MVDEFAHVLGEHQHAVARLYQAAGHLRGGGARNAAVFGDEGHFFIAYAAVIETVSNR
jgi:hypothetical protein